MSTSIIQSGQYRYVSAAPKYWYLHDTPVKDGQAILERYIRDAHRVFIEKASSLIDFKNAFTPQDEKHLQSMLTLLSDTRKTWEEGSK